MRIATMAGIQVMVSYWFIAMLFFFSLTGMTVKVLLVFSAVLLHEFAHAAAAAALGFKVREVELLPFGGVARIEGLGNASAKGEVIIAAAGPIASVVLAAIVYGGIFLFELRHEIWYFCYQANLMLAIFNMIPGLPLDGGRIFRALLAVHMDYGKATAIAAGVSKGIGILLVCIVIFQYLRVSTVNLSFLAAAIFLYTNAKSEVKVAGFRTLRMMAQKKALLRSRGVLPTMHLTVMESIVLRDLVRLFRPGQYHIMLVVNHECKVCGTLSETDVWEGLPLKGLHASVGELMVRK